LSPEVKHFISQLLVKDPARRLGGGINDGEELKQHPFFKVITFKKYFHVTSYKARLFFN